MIVNLNKISKKPQLHFYEVGLMANQSLHVVMVRAFKWMIHKDVLHFYRSGKSKNQCAIFTSWVYIRRVEENRFVEPLFVTKEFVKEQVTLAKGPKLLSGATGEK